jgi:hypothetical protein
MSLKTCTVCACVLLMAAGAVAQSSQQVARGSGGWGANSNYNRLYNQDAVVTFSGVVTGVLDSTRDNAPEAPGVSLLVRASNGGTATVDLGPKWFLENQNPQIRMKDRVTVTGSKVFVEGKSIILAQRVVKNNRVMYLRELNGFPMWVATRGHITVASNNPPRQPAQNETERYEGRITGIQSIDNGQAGVPSTVLVIDAGGNSYHVDIGPTWFIQRQDLQFQVGDNIVVNAVRPRAVQVGNVLLANEVARGNEFLMLRFQDGRPVWSTWGGP